MAKIKDWARDVQLFIDHLEPDEETGVVEIDFDQFAKDRGIPVEEVIYVGETPTFPDSYKLTGGHQLAPLPPEDDEG